MHNATHKQRREVQNFKLVTCARLELHLAPALIKAAGNFNNACKEVLITNLKKH